MEKDSRLGRWEYLILNIVDSGIRLLWFIFIEKRYMLGNIILGLDKEVENLFCYVIYDILKIVVFIFRNCTLRI